MSVFQDCCSLGLAVSSIVPVNASPELLWDVLTDLEALPEIVDSIQAVKIILPSASMHSSTASSSASAVTSSAASKGSRIIVGTQICEERRVKNKVVTLRQIVTNIVEDPEKKIYSISFNAYFDKGFPKAADFLCNTSTLSVIVPEKSTSAPSSCQLLGSCAVEVGGTGFCGPILLNRCCRQGFERHAKRKFTKELQDYAMEAERRRILQDAATQPR